MDKKPLPQKTADRHKRLAAALKRNIARRKAAKAEGAAAPPSKKPEGQATD